MWFWFFMFFCNLLVPILMLAFGRVMRKNPPKDINGVYGYRTKRSMQNQDTWDFAHACCGKLWQKLGWILLVPSILVQLPFIHGTENQIAVVSGVVCAVQIVVLIGSIFPVERALKKNFDDWGRKING